MALTKFLARDLTIEVDADGVPTWTAIGGLNTLTHAPTSTDADTTDFDSDGISEHMKAERGESWTLAGFMLEDVADGSRDTGQVRCEALGELMGLSSLGDFRITSPGGNTATFSGTVEVTRGGGGNNDPASWQCVIRISGDTTYA